MNRRSLPKVYTLSQMVRLVRAPDPHSSTGLRDRAILATMCATGVRASELCGLRVCDLVDDFVFIRRGKFGHQRWIPLSVKARAAIDLYLAQFRAQGEAPLFRSLSGRAISRRHLHKIITGYARPLGLRGGCHVIRHSAVTHWLNCGMDLEYVRLMTGHKSISTTQLYTHVSPRFLSLAYKRHVEAFRPSQLAA